jgi:hypothetical protein
MEYGLGLWFLTPLSTILKLYCGGLLRMNQLYKDKKNVDVKFSEHGAFLE